MIKRTDVNGYHRTILYSEIVNDTAIELVHELYIYYNHLPNESAYFVTVAGEVVDSRLDSLNDAISLYNKCGVTHYWGDDSKSG